MELLWMWLWALLVLTLSMRSYNFIRENVSAPYCETSENESKGKPSKEMIIKMYMGGDYVSAKGMKHCLGWRNGKWPVIKCLSVFEVKELITAECRHWMIWGQPNEEKFWGYDFAHVGLGVICVVLYFKPRGRNHFYKILRIEEKIQRHSDKTGTENSFETFRMFLNSSNMFL